MPIQEGRITRRIHPLLRDDREKVRMHVAITIEHSEGNLSHKWESKREYTVGPLNILVLERFLGYASPCLMDLFTPKNLMQMFEYLPAL
jgi:hypothetical protein